jgi:hypothetical protein
MNVLKHFIGSCWLFSSEGKVLSGSPYTEINLSGKTNVITDYFGNLSQFS